jgi:DNA polymerase III gamma/tau subunit
MKNRETNRAAATDFQSEGAEPHSFIQGSANQLVDLLSSKKGINEIQTANKQTNKQTNTQAFSWGVVASFVGFSFILARASTLHSFLILLGTHHVC